MVGKYDYKFKVINIEIVELCLFVKLKVIGEFGYNIYWENFREWMEIIINFLIKGKKKINISLKNIIRVIFF